MRFPLSEPWRLCGNHVKNTDISGPPLRFRPRLRSETRNSNWKWFRALVHSICCIFKVNKQITNTIKQLREQRNLTLRLTTRYSNSDTVTRRRWLPHTDAHWLDSHDLGIRSNTIEMTAKMQSFDRNALQPRCRGMRNLESRRPSPVLQEHR